MSIHLCVSAAEFKAILDSDSSTVLSLRLSSHRQTTRVGSEYILELDTIRKFYSVQHSTVYIILT